MATDTLLWVVLGVPVGVAWAGHEGYPLWLLPLAMVALAAAIGVSRRWPLASLFIVVALTGVDGNFVFALPVVSYLVGRRMASVVPAAIGFAVIVAGATPYVLIDAGFIVWTQMAGVLVYAGLFPWLVGRYRRQQQDLVAAGWEHAEQLEREQRMAADQVRLRERTRIAEDMHDSLGHELSLIALRAGALELDPDLGDGHRAAAGDLRASAGAATERLREIIGVLRDQTEPAPIRPVDEDIAELVRRAKDSGMAVDLTHEGGSGPLPPMVDRAAHRVVQEALTNANKHAPGAPVTVRITRTEGETTVTISNGPPPAGPLPSPGPGGAAGRRGLVGLSERVRLSGGTFRAGRLLSGGGFEVVAKLPYAAAPAPLTPESSTDRRRLVQRQARRGLIAAVAVPVALGVLLGGTAVAYFAYATANSVLSPEKYAQLSVGMEHAEVDPLLPDREWLNAPAEDGGPSDDCRYYRTDGDVLRVQLDIYRLCFADGRLITKDMIADPEVSRF